METATNVFRLPQPYQPPRGFAEAAPRFWDRVDRPPPKTFDKLDDRCWKWTRAMPPYRNWMWMQVGHDRFEVRQFAYLLQVDEIWPGLIPRPACRTTWCVRGDHLRLRRPTNRPFELAGVMSAAELRMTYDLRSRPGRRAHRQLKDVDAIARAYDVPTDWLMAQYDALRISGRGSL